MLPVLPGCKVVFVLESISTWSSSFAQKEQRSQKSWFARRFSTKQSSAQRGDTTQVFFVIVTNGIFSLQTLFPFATFSALFKIYYCFAQLHIPTDLRHYTALRTEQGKYNS